MFKNLFNKTILGTGPQTQEAPKKQSQREVETIEAIHNSFDVAADQALVEAKRIIDSIKISEEEASRVQLLRQAGFYNTKEVIVNNNITKEKEEAKKRADTVMYFKEHYPNYKFIFPEQVEKICTKYGLVCGDINRYKGNVPTKNLKEIVDFKIREEDEMVTSRNGRRYDSMEVPTIAELVDSLYLKNKKEVEADSKRSYKDDSGNTIFYYDNHYREIPKQICAPVKDMIIYANEKVEGNKIVAAAAPDPIVLQPVKDGFLVISKWGIEGNDQELVNNPEQN